jgi:hypothetical protein
MAVAFLLAHPYGYASIMSSFAFTDSFHGPPSDSRHNIVSPNPVRLGVGTGVDACGHGWVCEHRWPQVYGMVSFRNAVQGEPLDNWWSDGENKIGESYPAPILFSHRNLPGDCFTLVGTLGSASQRTRAPIFAAAPLALHYRRGIQLFARVPILQIGASQSVGEKITWASYD